MANTLLGVLPPLALPRVPSDQFGGHGLQQSFSASGEAADLPNDPKGGNALAWLGPAISSGASGGILGSLTQSDGLLTQSPAAWAQSPMPFRASGGILAPLARANDPREQSIPAWLQSLSRWSHEPNAVTWDSSTMPTPSALAPVFPSAPQRAAICQEIGIGYYRVDFIQVPRIGMQNGSGSLRRRSVQRKSKSWNY